MFTFPIFFKHPSHTKVSIIKTIQLEQGVTTQPQQGQKKSILHHVSDAIIMS